MPDVFPLTARAPLAFPSRNGVLSPPRTAVLLIAALTLLLVVVLPRPLSPDVSGQIWIADRLLHGARLYQDISEINPPLWFWLAMPIDGLAGLLHVQVESVLIVGLGCIASVSLVATDRLTAGCMGGGRTGFMLYGACILLVMPLRDLGQREQLALIGALPYAALLAARRDERSVPVWLALLVGAGAAIGFALKHYFICVPLLLEIWLLAGLRRAWRPNRPEVIVLVLAALIYVTAILVLTPAYVQVSLPELTLAYGATGALDFWHLVRPAQPVWVLLVCGLVVQRFDAPAPLPRFTAALMISGMGFFVAWLIQHKGWPYQSIATTGCLALALAVSVGQDVRLGAGRFRPLPMAALIATAFLFAFPTQWLPGPGSDISPALADLHAGDVVGILSTEGRTEWASTVGRDFRFAGRRGSLWFLAAVDLQTRGTPNPRVAALGRAIVRQTAIDYQCLPPRRIIVFPAYVAEGSAAASDNPLSYFMRDPRFAALLKHYRRMPREGNYAAFSLLTPPDRVPTANCQRGI